MARALLIVLLLAAAPSVALAQEGTSPGAPEPGTAGAEEDAAAEPGEETASESEEDSVAVDPAVVETTAPDTEEVEKKVPEVKDDPPTATVRSEEDLVDIALKNADVIAEHQARLEKAEWQQYRADWAWFPKVRAQTGLSVVPAQADPNNVDNNFDEIAALDIGPVVEQKVAVVIPVYTFDRISIARDLAKLGIDAEKLKLEGARRDVEFQVRRAYYAIQLSAALEELLAEGGQLIKDQLVEMEDARDFGEADFDIKDFRKLQIFDAEVDSRRLDNRKLDTLARAGVRYFSKVDNGFAVKEFVDKGEPQALVDLATYQAAARTIRPDARLLEQAVEARRLQRELAVSNFYPNVFIGADFRYVGSTEEIALRQVCRQTEPGGECVDTSDLIAPPYSNALDVLSFGVAVGLRWDFDYPQLYGKYREAVAQNDEVAAQRERALGAIDLEIEKLWTEATQAREKVLITDRRLEAARRWRDQFGLAINQGGGDIEDAVDPLKAFFEAKALNLQARFDYLVARAALAKAVGVRDLARVASP